MVKCYIAQNPKKRIKELQTGNPEVLNIVLTIECNSRNHARLVERTLHEQLIGVNVLGEWFKVRSDKLYKVLRRLAIDPNCDVIEEFNLQAPTEKTRSMLRAERKRNESQAKHINEVELALSKRKIKIDLLMKKLSEMGVSYKEQHDYLKSEEEKIKI